VTFGWLGLGLGEDGRAAPCRDGAYGDGMRRVCFLSGSFEPVDEEDAKAEEDCADCVLPRRSQ
jgi:hypothetical protein